MQTVAGLWIDHRKAVIVMISDDGEKTKRITSSVEKQLRRSGRSRPRPTYKSRGAAAGESREREYRAQPTDYYNDIVACIGAATMIFIFGPGEAKEELKKWIERNAAGQRVIRVETASEMTDDQIIEKVRKQFRTRSESPGPA